MKDQVHPQKKGLLVEEFRSGTMNRWNGGSMKRVSITKPKQDSISKKRRFTQQTTSLPIKMQSGSNETDSPMKSKIFRIQSTPLASSNRTLFQQNQQQLQQQEFSLDALSLQHHQQESQSTSPYQYETRIDVSRGYSTTPTSTYEAEDGDENSVQPELSRSSSRGSFNTPNNISIGEVELPKLFSKPVTSSSPLQKSNAVAFKPISPSLPNFTSKNDIESIPMKNILSSSNNSTTQMDDVSMKQFIFNNQDSKQPNVLNYSKLNNSSFVEEDNINFLDLIGCSSKEAKSARTTEKDLLHQQDSPTLQLMIPSSFLDSQPQQTAAPFLLSPKTPSASLSNTDKRKEGIEEWEKAQMQQQIQELQQENVQLKQLVESLRKQVHQLNSRNPLNLFSNGPMG